MSPITQYAIAAVLFVLGLAAIGGATFGRKRNQRLILAAIGIVLWGATLLLYAQAASQQTSASPTPTAAIVELPPSDTPTPPMDTPVAPLAETPASAGMPSEAPTPVPDIPGRIAFHSRRSGDLEIWTMNANGTQQQQLTDTPGRDIEPDWSPDGQLIAFTSARDDPENVQLYVMNADGSDQRRLMELIAANQLGPRWSSDGQWILYYANVDMQLDIFKVRTDGSEPTRLTDQPGNNFMPDWSPDGSRIVFVSGRDGTRELYVMGADGSNQVRLTADNFDNTRPRWSPDGTTLLFESNRDGLANLYLMDAPPADVRDPYDGNIRLITFPGFNDVAPTWAVGGSMVVFGSDRTKTSVGTANWDVYIMNADGSDVVRLTTDDELDRFPAWTP